MIGKNEFFFSNFLEDISPFCGATDTPVSDSGDVCPRFQSQSVFPCLCALLPGCKVSGYHADTPITIKAEPFIWPTAALINIHEHPI